MKNIFIAVLIFLGACSTNSEEKIFSEYLTSYSRIIETIDIRKEYLYENFISEVTDEYNGNPKRSKPWYDKAMLLKQSSNNLIKTINRIENSANNNYKVKSLENLSPKELKTNEKLSKKNIELLKKEFTQFNSSLISIIGKDTVLYNIKTESINSNLNIKDWQNIPCLNGDKSKIIELSVVLAKLKMNVKLAEFDLLLYLYGHIGGCSYKFNRVVPIVVPNSKTIPLGYEYTANIFLGPFDSTVIPIIFIENKPIKVQSGVGFYKEKVSSKDTLVQRKGYFLLTNPETRKPLKVPFQLEYEVIPD